MSSVTLGGAYPLGGPEPRGVSSRYSVPLDGITLSLGPFPFTPRSISIINQTAATITVTDDRGEQYVAASLTEVTYGLGPTLYLSAALSQLVTSGKATVVVYDTPQPVSSSQLASLAPSGVIGGNLLIVFDRTLAVAAPSFDTGAIIPAGSRLLRCYLYARGDAGVGSEVARIQFNGDVGANYEWLFSRVSNTAVLSGNAAGGVGGIDATGIPGATADANTFGHNQWEIPDYDNSVAQKTLVGQSFFHDVGAFVSQTWAGTWRSLAAINRITLTPGAGGNFIAGSRFVVIAE